jgi:hypothetical protein
MSCANNRFRVTGNGYPDPGAGKRDFNTESTEGTKDTEKRFFIREKIRMRISNLRFHIRSIPQAGIKSVGMCS